MVGLKVDHFLPKKTQNTLMLTAMNTLNINLTSATLDPVNPFMNRARHMVNIGRDNKNLIKYLNIVRDLADVRNYYSEMGGDKQSFAEKLDEIEDQVVDEHKEVLRDEIPKMLGDPRYQPYMKDLVKHYAEDGIITENEVKYFEGEMKLKELADELALVKDKKKRRRLLGGHRLMFPTGLDKAKLLNQYTFKDKAFYDPIETLLILKKDPEDFGIAPDEIDSLTLLQQRQALGVALRRLKVTGAMTEEQKFMAEKLGLIITDSQKMGEDRKKLADKGRKVKFKPGLIEYKLDDKEEEEKKKKAKKKKKVSKRLRKSKEKNKKKKEKRGKKSRSKSKDKDKGSKKGSKKKGRSKSKDSGKGSSKSRSKSKDKAKKKTKDKGTKKAKKAGRSTSAKSAKSDKSKSSKKGSTKSKSKTKPKKTPRSSKAKPKSNKSSRSSSKKKKGSKKK